MKAVVMAGGEGTRLRPLTSNQPKPMVPIVGKPCMEHILELLKQHGFEDVETNLIWNESGTGLRDGGYKDGKSHFVFDLETPADFTPRNTDGEIAEFHPMPVAEVIACVRDGDEFKFNVNLVIIDFALRHGLIAPDEPDYLDMVTGLRQPLD